MAGAEYSLKSKLNRFIGCDVFNAVLIERDRETRTADPITLMTALATGASLILFPGGTRNETEESLLPFKSGLYNLALAKPEIDLVPCLDRQSQPVMPKARSCRSR